MVIEDFPIVMGILNVTPDSFYDGGLYRNSYEQLSKVEQMLEEGASIIDVGAVSSRPGSNLIDKGEEISRLIPVLKVIRTSFPGIVISVDTFRAEVAEMALESGADIINDIYGGTYDGKMPETMARLNKPYIIMHMKGSPADMQHEPVYEDVVEEIYRFFEEQTSKLEAKGFHHIAIDPGFGFGKSLEHNYEILQNLDRFKKLGYPVLAGFSRKSMINSVLGVWPSEALNGTTVLNTIALLKGVDILRVHDVKQAMEVIKLVKMLPDYAASLKQ
jgi:dihydropteroate synthase